MFDTYTKWSKNKLEQQYNLKRSAYLSIDCSISARLVSTSTQSALNAYFGQMRCETSTIQIAANINRNVISPDSGSEIGARANSHACPSK